MLLLAVVSRGQVTGHSYPDVALSIHTHSTQRKGGGNAVSITDYEKSTVVEGSYTAYSVSNALRMVMVQCNKRPMNQARCSKGVSEKCRKGVDRIAGAEPRKCHVIAGGAHRGNEYGSVSVRERQSRRDRDDG